MTDAKSNPDDIIRAALDEDDKEWLASLDNNRGIFQQIGDSWKGPLGGWAKFATFLAIIIGLGLLAVIWQVANTRDPVEHTLWAIAALAVLIVQGFLKEWLWARMNMLTVLREVKRLQVQVALLSEEKRG
ncbi:MAG: DUF6768 family protein [Pseudomonadota bacterium]